MGKAAGILAVVGVGGTGLAIGGVYLSRMFSKYVELPSDIELFKKSDGGGCVQWTFPGLESVNKPTNLEDVQQSDKKIGEQDSDPVEGCLVINWDKWNGKENNKDKWRGKFRFLWAMVRGDKGFIVYLTIPTPNPSTEANGTVKLSAKGLAYALNRDTNRNKWNISKGKEIENIELEASKFPKLGDALKVKKDQELKYADGDENFGKLCSDTDCPDSDYLSEYFRAYWSWKESKESSSDAVTADAWSSNLEDWWQKIYSDDKWKMKDMLKGIKGKWEAMGGKVLHSKEFETKKAK